METLLIITLLVIAAETTYLTVTSARKQQRAMQSPVFVDTSVLIDGRIIAIAESGFITRPLYIPRSVVGELQFLADNADTEKRSRARHGLDIINQLQSITAVTTVIFADGVRAEEGVDNRLLTLAKKHNGALCTIDYNLNKVAVVEGIQVLNVNELAKSLRMAYLPGEKIMIHLTQKGNDAHQAVGHLPDGTMVVVEHAHKLVGSTVEVEFIRSLQTAAGKMMFAKLAQSASQPNQQPKKQQKPTGRQTQQRKEKEALIPEQTAPAPSQQPQKPAGQPRQSQSRPQRTQQPQQQPRQQSNRRTRKSPEDSLVELANK
jgi:uncharacterized protein YacL